jgi:hypothetical protein
MAGTGLWDRRRLRTVLMVIAMAASPGLSRPANADTKSLLVSIHQRTVVDAAVLARATKGVTRIYAQAGVTLTWRDSPSAPDASPLEISVVLVSNDLLDRTQVTSTVMGLVPASERRAGRVAYVFYDRVRSVVRQQRLELSIVLAHVISHEIGHLLLPSASHSPVGLMRANWTRADARNAERGSLLFTSDQAAEIQGRITAGPVGGSIRGIVRDAAGMPIPHAQISATSLARDETWTISPDDTGRFRFDFLPTGPHRLLIRAAGFADHRREVTPAAEHDADVSILLIAGQGAAVSPE